MVNFYSQLLVVEDLINDNLGYPHLTTLVKDSQFVRQMIFWV